ncbi:MAG: sodium:proton antiporter [Lachnospiraceae bacterium]|nr:sodium:proton antiporter [Lachnospiraceae bacterium]
MEYRNLLLILCLGGLLIAMIFGLIRAIRGPRRADRILGVNMSTSISMAAIAILAVYLKENWLLDVCLVYCLIGFLAVVILTKVHISEIQEAKDE